MQNGDDLKIKSSPRVGVVGASQLGMRSAMHAMMLLGGMPTSLNPSFGSSEPPAEPPKPKMRPAEITSPPSTESRRERERKRAKLLAGLRQRKRAIRLETDEVVDFVTGWSNSPTGGQRLFLEGYERHAEQAAQDASPYGGELDHVKSFVMARRAAKLMRADYETTKELQNGIKVSMGSSCRSSERDG